MNIVEKKLSELKPYEKNPRNNDEAVKYVANSIKEFGFKVPIVIDKDNVIVTGHTRYKASRMLGLEEVPCIIADDLTPEQIKAFRIADNKTSDKATWDIEVLGDELKEVLDSFDMTDFGFANFEITMLTEDFTPTPYDTGEYEEYSENAEKHLAKQRVIITYTDEGKMAEFLGIPSVTKVVYDLEEFENGR